jgi:hypothetical protein
MNPEWPFPLPPGSVQREAKSIRDTREIAGFGHGVVMGHKLYSVNYSLTYTIVLRRAISMLRILEHDYLLLSLAGKTCAASLIAKQYHSYETFPLADPVGAEAL